MLRNYVAGFWIDGTHQEMEFSSNHRANSRKNREDAMRKIRSRYGAFVADNAEIAWIHRAED